MKTTTPHPDLFSSHQRNKLRQEFYDALQHLTKDQKKAVEQIEGPVMVLAGPGTGKTQVLAARYGYILDQTDTNIQQILCLTYTEAGVSAMRERLIQFIGPAAHTAEIYTFHAFCNKVIQENPEYFFDYKKFKLADKLSIYEIIEQVMDELPDEHPFKRMIGDKHFDVKRLERQYNNIKKEERDVNEMAEQVNHYMEHIMPNDSDYINKSVKHTKKFKVTYETDRAKFLRNTEALLTYPSFNEKMKAAHLLDYNDQLIYVKDAFIQYPDLLSKYQESYLYFLIDEFQDTNGIQNKILLSLCNYWEKPNLFVVGDDDQAIFRFQGADQQNLQTIIERYPTLDLVCITENFRSTQSILDASNHIIEKMIGSRLHHNILELPPAIISKINKKLIAAKQHQYNHPPTLKSFINTQQETLAVYEFIKERWMEDPNSLSEVAIIVRRNKNINELAYLLELDGIPINLKNAKDILDEPFIQHFILLLKYLNAEYQESQSGEPFLIQLLYLPYWGLSYKDVAQIAFLEKKSKLNKNLAEKIILPDSWPSTLFENKKSLEDFIHKTQQWMAALPPVKTLLNICEDILRSSGLLQWALSSMDRNWHLRSINSLFKFIQNESFTHPQLGLSTLLDKLTKMIKMEIDIPVEAGYASDKGVNLLTAHGAKGQEFETVWIMNTVQSEWESFMYNGDSPYKLPSTVMQLEQTNKDYKLHDERRLFYVAMTRAKYNLIISWSTNKTDNPNQIQTPSIFVTELSEYLNIKEHPTVKVSDDLLMAKMQLIQNRNLTPPALLDHDLIDEYLKSFVLSCTALNTYMECPRKFYFEEILKVPKAPNAHLGLGMAVHEALHEFFYQALSNDAFDDQTLVSLFTMALKRYEWYFSPDEYEGLLRRFRHQLPLFLKEHYAIWTNVEKFKLEYYIDKTLYNGIPINGKIDQVLIKNGQALIIDFKSGKGDSSSSEVKLKPPYRNTSKGGDYWRQCAFYKLLLGSDTTHTWNVEKSGCLFLQSNKLLPNEFTYKEYTFSDADLNQVSNQIKETFTNIHQHQFDQGCNKVDCDWCNYIKAHQIITDRL